jgi:hypothetical protein
MNRRFAPRAGHLRPCRFALQSRECFANARLALDVVFLLIARRAFILAPGIMEEG